MRTHNPNRIAPIFISLLFISQLPFFSTQAEKMVLSDPSISIVPDLLIILSPQYSQDPEILAAILSYSEAVQNDLGWTTSIRQLQENENDFQYIDNIIETTYYIHALKACIMVGEDISTALGGDADYLEQPSILPWACLGGNQTYDVSKQGIICQPTKIDICISLLYPTHELPFQQKKSDIIAVFHKFATQRHSTNPNNIKVFESSSLNTNSKALYQKLETYGSVSYTEDATGEDLSASLQLTYRAFFVHGHSTPAGTDVNTHQNLGWFPTKYLDYLQTPIFGADGCYVGGWWSNHTDNDKLDPSIDADWYGSKIFSSPCLQIMALGLLSQTGFSEPVSFLENIFPSLLQGKTFAESMIGQISIGDTIFVGDPSFHFA
jgi:hypothetical protein